MDANLQRIVAALAKLTDAKLSALIATASSGPQTARGLLAWIEHGADWELHRREGLDYPLQPPSAAIDPSEKAASVTAAALLREQFAQDVPTVAALFTAIVGTLTRTGSLH